jgi:6-phosphogluconolactonase
VGRIEVVVRDIPVLARRFAEEAEAAARLAAAERGRFSLVLPGGSSAEAFLLVLATAALDWRRADLFWGDERAVPPDHPDSNYRLFAELLPPGRAARVHRMIGEAPGLEAAAADYEREMREALGPAPRLDVALMGMGPDGHVCSLFPGHPGLRETRRWVIPVTDSPKPPPSRLTLTRPALALVQTLVIAAFGEAKAEVLRSAIEDETSSLPAALVARGAARSLFLLDEPAASGLDRRRFA